jgi:GT2 family glycosyltransferase
MPEISIIIPTWNTALVTKKCIATIKKYSPKGFVEIVVVDNGSTDDTEKILSKIIDIIYIRNSSNLGFSKANNIGVKKTTGKYFLFLNSDMEFLNDKLPDMLKFYRQNPNCGLIGPQFVNPDGSIQGSIMPPQSPKNAFKEFWLGQKSYSKYSLNTKLPNKVWAISGGAVLISREIFDKVGGWNEKYFFYYEDLDLCRSVRDLNKDVYYFPSFQVIHRHGVSGKSLADSSNQWRRLVPSSIKYHGIFMHQLINFIIWSGQKWQKLFGLT